MGKNKNRTEKKEVKDTEENNVASKRNEATESYPKSVKTGKKKSRSNAEKKEAKDIEANEGNNTVSKQKDTTESNPKSVNSGKMKKSRSSTEKKEVKDTEENTVVKETAESDPKSANTSKTKKSRSTATRVINDTVRLHIAVIKAHSMPCDVGGYVQWPQPYVTATLLPFQWSQSTKKCPTSGCEPTWGVEQDNHMYFTPKSGSLGW